MMFESELAGEVLAEPVLPPPVLGVSRNACSEPFKKPLPTI
jgi:hypothetical protein